MPDRLAVSHSLLHGRNTAQVAVPILLKNESTEELYQELVKIDRIEREDGSGENFNFKGFAISNKVTVDMFWSYSNSRGTLTYRT